MSERSTGATDSQIEAAENRCEEGGQFNAVWIRDLAEYLVPPGYEIVPVSPVRADRDAVVERETIAQILYETIAASWNVASTEPLREIQPWDSGVIDQAWFRSAADAVLAALRATPEPERAEVAREGG